MAPNILSLHHVAINVRDLEEARIFYSDVLGFTELEAPAMAIEQGIRWFDLGDGRALHLIQTAESSPTGRAHFAISVSNAKAWRAHIEQAGLDILEPTVELYNANRFFLRDPWGNLFEFVQWLGYVLRRCDNMTCRSNYVLKEVISYMLLKRGGLQCISMI